MSETEKRVERLTEAYRTNQRFKEYADGIVSQCESRKITLDQVLSWKITEFYYESIIPGGCNYKDSVEVMKDTEDMRDFKRSCDNV